MKKLFVLLLSVTSFILVSAQQASDYFPPLGSAWYLKNTTLDSLNKPVDSLTFFSVDSFALQTSYKGKNANVILSRNLQFDAIPADTSYVHFDDSDAWSYMDAFSMADSIPAADSIGVVSFLSSFTGWFPVFKFAQAMNVEYDIVKRDTTFVLDTLIIPIRVHVTGKRLPDQSITTTAGTFNCKTFLISPSIGIVLSPVLPPIPLIEMKDTVWIAENRWVVKDVMPATQFIFALFSGPSFYLPGSATELVDKPTSVNNEENRILTFYLKQNYPNPFNPETRIEFTLNERSEVKLSIFNTLGEQIAILFEGEKPSGNHQINFNAGNLTSGIYFYTLKTDKFSQTKKMILLR